MELQYKDGREISDSIGLLISILVCYPEICRVKFIPEGHLLRFSFLLKGIISMDKFRKFQEKMFLSLEIYGEWNRKFSPSLSIQKQEFDGITLLEIICGINALTREEISLINELIRQEFEEMLVMDQREPLVDEELFFQEALIENMLESIRDSAPEKSLIGFREEGRVMVFNK